MDDDGDNNDNSSVDDDGGVDVNDANDAKSSDSMRKTDSDDADGSNDNSNDDGSFDDNGASGKGFVDRKDRDEAHYGDNQTESVEGDPVKCNGFSKTEMRVEVMWCEILKETQR